VHNLRFWQRWLRRVLLRYNVCSVRLRDWSAGKKTWNQNETDKNQAGLLFDLILNPEDEVHIFLWIAGWLQTDYTALYSCRWSSWNRQRVKECEYNNLSLFLQSIATNQLHITRVGILTLSLYLLTYTSFLHLFICSFIHSFIPSFHPSFIRSSITSLICSFIRSLIP
jgi:hypothetical protein